MKNTKILIVEDESIVALEIATTLEHLGYTICGQVGTGEEAVSEAAATTPDLILMDINLKGELDGIEAAAIIREQLRTPVVYLTAYSDEETTRRAKLTSPLGYIQKPFKEDGIRIALEMALYTAKLEAEREQMTQQLVISEQRYQDLFNSMIDGFAVHEMLFDDEGNPLDYRFLNVNPAFEKFTGLKGDDIVGKTVLEVLPETELIWIERYGNVVKTGQPMHFNNYSAALGKYFDVSAYRIGSNLFACAFVDITAKKRSEERLARESRVNSALAGIATRLIGSNLDIPAIVSLVIQQAISVTESAFGFATVTDIKTRELACYTLPSFRTQFSLEADPNQEGAVIMPDPLKELIRPESYLENRIDDVAPANMDTTLHIEDCLSVPIFLDGAVSGHIILLNSTDGFTEDDLRATEQIGELFTLAIQRFRIKLETGEMQDQIRQMQKMEAIGTLAGGIAHDFNNILQPIMGYTNMVLQGIEKSDRNHRFLTSILNASMRARDLVQQILTFSRTSVQELQPVEIQVIIKETIRLMRSSLPATIEIKQKIAKDCCLVMAEPTKIHQIVMNLATNAFQAMQESGGSIFIELATVHLNPDDVSEREILPGDYVRLTVADTGEGIEPRVLDKIFDPYFTTKDQSKGTGLGLSVVMGIVKSFKGFVRVQSEVGEGTEFNVFLPQVRDEAIDVSQESGQQDITGTEKILLIDDESMIVDLLKNMMEELGYQVTESVSSVEAVEMFHKHPEDFDLVVTDMTMPNMTGADLARKVMSIRPEIPVIMCTGFSDLVNEEKARSMGIRKLLLKPITMSQLGSAIREVLD